jgi:hypothetical protein
MIDMVTELFIKIPGGSGPNIGPKAASIISAMVLCMALVVNFFDHRVLEVLQQ